MLMSHTDKTRLFFSPKTSVSATCTPPVLIAHAIVTMCYNNTIIRHDNAISNRIPAGPLDGASHTL